MRRILFYVPPEPPTDLHPEMLHLFKRIWPWLPELNRWQIRHETDCLIAGHDDLATLPPVTVAHILEDVAIDARSLGGLSRIAFSRILRITRAAVAAWVEAA